MEDDILEQVRAAKEAFAAKHDYDIHAMFATLRKNQESGGRLVVDFSKRESPVEDDVAAPLIVVHSVEAERSV